MSEYPPGPGHPVQVSWSSRPYRTAEDYRQIQAMLMEARLRSTEWHYPHVGDLAWPFFMVLCHLDPREHVRLWYSRDKLIGFAVLGEDPSFECQFLPGNEWPGIEGEALAWAEGQLAVLRGREPSAWGGHLVAVARADDGRRIAFLEQQGFRYWGGFPEVNMLRSLDDPVAAPVVPPGYRVGSVDISGGIADRAGAHREVWHPWSVGKVSDEDYLSLMGLPGYDRELDLVTVTPDGIVAAYVNGWVDPVNLAGCFGPVGARPEFRRQGLTRAALLEGLRRMRERGMHRVHISTGVGNTAAIGLYESVGFRIVNRTLDYAKKR